MSFDKFPLDQQRCMFRVGSYSYDNSKMVFHTKKYGYSGEGRGNSIALDYHICKYKIFISSWSSTFLIRQSDQFFDFLL